MNLALYMEFTRHHDRSDAKQRLLTVACRMFAERGYHGTHIREICEQAGTNIATVGYYFDGKEKLYEAVLQEARRQLQLPAEDDGLLPSELPILIQSLLRRLTADGGWVARLLVRELVESPGLGFSSAGAGLREDFTRLQTAIQERTGADVEQFAPLSLLALCVFYSAAGRSLQLAMPEFDEHSFQQDSIAQHLAQLVMPDRRNHEHNPETPRPRYGHSLRQSPCRPTRQRVV
jgi:AcrR family transcriptional regulator